MYWFVLFSICAFLFVAIMSKREELIMVPIFSLFLSLGGCIFLFLISLFYQSIYPYETVFQESGRIKIISLKDNSYSSGSFVLGTGSFNSSMRYYFMTKNNDGGMNMEDIPSNSTTIYEKDSDPTVIQYDTVFVSPRTKWSLPRFVPRETKYDIIVPIGTVVKNLSIDLEGK